MWSILLPSYFLAFYAYHQSALLALCLVLNAYIMLGCLFVPKIYAVIFVKEDRLTYVPHKLTATGAVTSISSSQPSTSQAVASRYLTIESGTRKIKERSQVVMVQEQADILE